MNWHNVFTKKLKTVYLQGFGSKSVHLKCFGNQLKIVYLQGPHSSRPCISRPCCTAKLPKTSTNLNLCSIKIGHLVTYV